MNKELKTHYEVVTCFDNLKYAELFAQRVKKAGNTEVREVAE